MRLSPSVEEFASQDDWFSMEGDIAADTTFQLLCHLVHGKWKPEEKWVFKAEIMTGSLGATKVSTYTTKNSSECFVVEVVFYTTMPLVPSLSLLCDEC